MKAISLLILTTIIALTLNAQTVKDVDGNTYKTVKIGSQTWMAENLRTTKTPSGTEVKSYAPKGVEDSVAEYGRLYDWATARTVCPSGWRIPSDSDWQALITFLGGPMVAGGKIKETGTSHWKAPNKGATNETGFTALPLGYVTGRGKFVNFNNRLAYWWSGTEADETTAWGVYITYGEPIIYRYSFSFTKDMSFAVRCVKN